MLTKIVNFFHEGGPTMYVTATVGLIGVAITIERVSVLYFKTKQNTKLFMSRIKELLLQNRVEDAIQYCNMESHLPLSRIVKSGLERLGCDETLIRQSMESTYLETTPRLTERIPYTGLIANGGLLFGLLGTVLGLIKQFTALASVDATDKQMLMDQGIAEAMNNTALGLMVALPMLLIHGILSAKSTSQLEEIETGSSQFMDWVGLYNYGELENRLNKSSNGTPSSDDTHHIRAA
jgi:biopolymer transport protein ExbB